MPRLTAGGPSVDAQSNDEAIIRVDVTPEDIRKMSDEEISSLLEGIRNKRETAAPRASRTTRQGQPTKSQNAPEDLEEMD